MRTTVDIPDNLLRRAKADAALRGLSFKQYLATVIRSALQDGFAAQRRSDATAIRAAEDQQVMGKGCVFPLIRGEGGPALRDLTPKRVHEILEEEDAEHATAKRGLSG